MFLQLVFSLHSVRPVQWLWCGKQLWVSACLKVILFGGRWILGFRCRWLHLISSALYSSSPTSVFVGQPGTTHGDKSRWRLLNVHGAACWERNDIFFSACVQWWVVRLTDKPTAQLLKGLHTLGFSDRGLGCTAGGEGCAPVIGGPVCTVGPAHII